MRYLKPIALLFVHFFILTSVKSQAIIHVNQVGFYKDGPKAAVLEIPMKSVAVGKFELVSANTNKVLFSKKTLAATPIKGWFKEKLFYKLDFSGFNQSGSFKLKVNQKGKAYYSNTFTIAQQGLSQLTIPSIIHYYNRQRANTKEELEADVKISPNGSTKKVDMRGGWAGASGDISKYFSHLAYANYMSPQQIPLVTWSLANTKEAIPDALRQ